MPNRADVPCSGGCGRMCWRSRTGSAPKCRECRRVTPAAWKNRGASVTRWDCGWCGTACERPPTKGQRPKWCSDSCGNLARLARRDAVRGEFSIPKARRRRLYERDAWTCQICGEGTSRSWSKGDLRSPTLDHIEPQSHSLIPDHSDANLRTAHWLCNQLRRDAALTDAEVRALVVARWGVSPNGRTLEPAGTANP